MRGGGEFHGVISLLFLNLLGGIHMGHSLVTAMITEGAVMVPAKAASTTRDLLEGGEISPKEFHSAMDGRVGQKMLWELFT